jgi:hypothetical protein
MIHYDLVCAGGHAFDGWFQGSAAFDEQAKQGLLACPECGGRKVEKALMTPGLPVKSNARKTPAPTPAGPAQEASLVADDRKAKVREAVRELHRQVKENADYVGDRFAEEARRIYYAETKERGIYGEATLEDARSLHEEGIDVLPLPILPEDRN